MEETREGCEEGFCESLCGQLGMKRRVELTRKIRKRKGGAVLFDSRKKTREKCERSSTTAGRKWERERDRFPAFNFRGKWDERF